MTDRGRTALVTGASSGVGRAVARRLGAEGGRVCLTGRNGERLEATADDVREAGGSPFVYPADLLEEAEIRSLGERVGEEHGRLDVLVHSAGVIGLGALEDAPASELDWQYATNLRAPYVLTQAVLPLLREGDGDVVFVNSTSGLDASAEAGAYAATKHALRGLADSFRDEVNEDGMRVLSVFLGRTATPMQEEVHGYEDRPFRPDRLIQPADVAEMIVTAVTLPRTAEVTEFHIRPARKP